MVAAGTDVPGGLPSPVPPNVPTLVEETQAAAQRRKRGQTAAAAGGGGGGGGDRSCVDTVQRTTSR